jgi:hypothetical protein
VVTFFITHIEWLLIFFCYPDIGMKFSTPLTITNLHWKICGAHKVSSHLPTEYSTYIECLTVCLKEPKLLPIESIYC